MRRKVQARGTLGAMVAGALVVGLSACGGVVNHDPNLIAGKQAFVQKCGACHKLQRASTTGVSGPDLDAAFQRSLQDGMKRSTVEGVVLRQIGQPNRSKQIDPETLKETIAMPANLVKGGLARDVAAYVASVSARSGEDTGRLGEIGAKKATKATSEKNGELDIPTDPTGALAYQFASATAQPGQVSIKSKNDASIPHNIAIEGNGVNDKGAVVQGGGVSEVSVDLKPGEYTFFCSVPGHREGGMEGKITVK
jgi:plastocyanin/cytochrome c2